MNVSIYEMKGGRLIADTGTYTGTWKRIQVVTAATFNGTGTTCNITGLTGVALPVNMIVDGSFTSIALSSGSIIAYDR